MRKQVKIMLTVAMSALMALTSFTQSVSAAGVLKSAIAQGKKEVDLDAGKYHAYFMFQDNISWVFRNAFYDPQYGIKYKNFNKMVTSLNVSDPKVVDGTIKDCEIKGNGTYTVGVSGLNGCVSDKAVISILAIDTDIPYNETVKISNIDVAVDGISRYKTDTPHLSKDCKETPHLLEADIINTWQKDYESTALVIPKDSVTITFTVSGFKYDNPDAKAATPKPAANTSEASQKTSGKGIPVIPIAIAAGVLVVIVVVVVVKKRK